MYKVIVDFTDKEDNNHRYSKGDTFPRDNVTVGKSRLDYLASDKNLMNMPVIEQVREKKTQGKEKK